MGPLQPRSKYAFKEAYFNGWIVVAGPLVMLAQDYVF